MIGLGHLATGDTVMCWGNGEDNRLGAWVANNCSYQQINGSNVVTMYYACSMTPVAVDRL